jgi:UDP-N-acetylmuramate--alanine ligase
LARRQEYLSIEPDKLIVENSSNSRIHTIKLKGLYNRLDAWLAISGVHHLFNSPLEELVNYINHFPGLQRRMEEIIPNLYSDEAHTPEKITGAMSVASEIASEKNQKVIVVFEPLTNRRQHFMLKEYKDCFSGSEKVYWLPSYLAREDPNQRIIPPSELISNLTNPGLAEAQEKGPGLNTIIKNHLDHGDLVVCMSGGSGGSLDEWVRDNFK